MARSLTVRNIYDKKYITFPFDGIFERAMGHPETNGAWIIYGMEKNGKTWLGLLLAKYLSKFKRVWYISAEEGLSKDFRDAMKRAKIDTDDKRLAFDEYMPIEDMALKLKSRKGPRIVFVDNLTIYADELRGRALMDLIRQHPDVLFVFLAHEEKKEPYGAAAKMCKKMARLIIHVKGLAAHISGRCPGGVINIDEDKAALYWGVAS